MNKLSPILAVIGLVFSSLAAAHVTIENNHVKAGSYHKVVFEVPHGCSGSATTAIRVKIPEGVVSVKPKPKQGWTINMQQGDYAHTYHVHGSDITHGVTVLSWQEGHLDNNYFDEFSFVAYFTPALIDKKQLAFPVVQECDQGVTRWIDDPDSDSSTPAPVIHIQD